MDETRIDINQLPCDKEVNLGENGRQIAKVNMTNQCNRFPLLSCEAGHACSSQYSQNLSTHTGLVQIWYCDDQAFHVVSQLSVR